MDNVQGVKKRKRVTVISSSDDEVVGEEDTSYNATKKIKVKNCSTLPECKIIVTRLKDRLVQGKENKTKPYKMGKIIGNLINNNS